MCAVVGSLLLSGFHYRGLKVKYEIFSAGTDASYLRIVSCGCLCVGPVLAPLCCAPYVVHIRNIGLYRVYCAVVFVLCL